MQFRFICIVVKPGEGYPPELTLILHGTITRRYAKSNISIADLTQMSLPFRMSVAPILHCVGQQMSYN
jgi:hypothetical protein